jgi:hypothetical protein
VSYCKREALEDHEYRRMDIGRRDSKREALEDHRQCHFGLDHGKVLAYATHTEGQVRVEVIPPAISKPPSIELVSVGAPRDFCNHGTLFGGLHTIAPSSKQLQRWYYNLSQTEEMVSGSPDRH